MLEPQGITTVTCNLLEYELDRQSASQVLCASHPTTMLLDPALDVQRDASVETAIGTTQNIDAV